MAFKEKGFQTAAALCVGATAIAFGAPPAGVPEDAMAAAGLIGFVLDGKSRFGPECPRVLKKIRARVREGYEALLRHESKQWHAHADLEAADLALHETLQSCMLDRARLAAAAVSPEGFPQAALIVVMNDLAAKRPDLFGPDKTQTLGFRYARDVVRVGLEAAVENVDYYRALEPALMLELATALGEVRDTGRRIDKTTQETGRDVQEVKSLVTQVLANQESDAGRGLLEELAINFGHDNPAATGKELRAFLDSKVEDYIRLKVQIAALAEADGRVANLVSAAQSAVDTGDFQEADSRLKDAEEIQLAEHTLKEIGKQVDIRAARAEAALLSGDTKAALAFYQTAARLFDPFDPDVSAQARHSFQIILYEHGQRYGGSGLGGSVILSRENLAIFTEEEQPLEWAATQNNLGNALRSQGERTPGAPGAALLAEAVTAYRAALRVRTEQDHPLDWAMTQNNLGNALGRQGERTQGQAGDDLLAQAVVAYRAAMKVFTKNNHPLDWALAQNNLGHALRSQGDRTKGGSGAEFFAEAVTACQAALTVYTENNYPLYWAATSNNLSIALASQGERTHGQPGINLIAEAVSSCRAALRVYTIVDYPVQWAMTQNNLGNALRSQGERTPGASGASLLAEAVTAYRAALRVRTEEDHPLDWSMTQNNLGIALGRQGARTAGQSRADLLADAVTAHRVVLRVYTEDDHPIQWAMTQINLGTALSQQGLSTKGQKGTSLLVEAIAAYRTAMNVLTEDHHPFQWAMTQENIGYALATLADRQKGAERLKTLKESLGALNAALTVFEADHTSFYFEKCQRARDQVVARLDG